VLGTVIVCRLTVTNEKISWPAQRSGGCRLSSNESIHSTQQSYDERWTASCVVGGRAEVLCGWPS